MTTVRVQPCRLAQGSEPIASEAGRTVPVGNRQVRNLPRLNALPQVPEQLALAVRASADFRQPLVHGGRYGNGPPSGLQEPCRPYPGRRVSASVSYCWPVAVCLAGKVPARSMTCRRAGRTPRWWGILNSNKATASAIANHWGGASPWAPGCGQKLWASRLPPRMMPVKTCSDVRKCSFKSRMTRAVLGCRL